MTENVSVWINLYVFVTGDILEKLNLGAKYAKKLKLDEADLLFLQFISSTIERIKNEMITEQRKRTR
jgi:hypothetical protein